jgi:hypothetical protein
VFFSFILINRRIVAKTAGVDENSNYKAGIVAKIADQERNCKYHTKKGQESEKDPFQNNQNESLTKAVFVKFVVKIQRPILT